jgi:GNAT superfamily N-acetyltransferase
MHRSSGLLRNEVSQAQHDHVLAWFHTPGGEPMSEVIGTPVLTVRAITAADRTAVVWIMQTLWGGSEMVVHDEVIYPAELPGFIAEVSNEIVGLVTYRVVADRCELVSLDSRRPGNGIGTALMAHVEAVAEASGCSQVWLVTTNDNLRALRFYQKSGYRIIGVDPGAVDRARAVKPTIPRTGEGGIPIRDELTLVKALGPDDTRPAGS